MTLPATLPDLPSVHLDFDPALPIAQHAEELAELIERHQVVIVAGETGSGKTTQLPKIALAIGRRRIAHTQPRRIAARTVSERVASELQVSLGDVVGYQVRFTKQAGKDTRIKVMTDGVLLAEISRDRDLRRYDTIIIDEAHERSLNIDFLLGYLKQLLPRRPDLKVIVTSATIDTQRFSEHFGDAPIVEVSGRTYPVEVRYHPIDEDGDQVSAIADAVTELWTEGTGDILVFCSGEREIRDAAEGITALGIDDLEVLPLYARLSSAEQQRVFQPHRGRRVVLATNVAETSITVPGIRYVVDPGTARISRYSVRTKVQRLPIEPISQASANQRAGRCGRVAPGVCIRLYSEEDFQTRPEFTEPEILRTNLASVILQMAQAELGEISSFPFVEPPDERQVTDGLRLLDELGALKPGHRKNPRLTKVGHTLARLPVDPRLARMLIEAQQRDCLREVLVLVAALSIPDVRERPADKREQADALHARFASDVPPERQANTDEQGRPLRHTAHTNTRAQTKPPVGEGGDLYTLLRLWEHLQRSRKRLSGNAFRRMCRDEFINFLRVREWEDMRTQLKQLCRDLGWHPNSSAASTDAVLTSVLSGLLSHVGLADLRDNDRKTSPSSGRKGRRGPREYLGSRGTRFAINPGSVLAKSPPPLVMAVELVETTRLWARTVAEIDAEQIEQVGGHLLKRSHSEPHWSSNSGSVVAYEKVTLLGVPIVAERPVNFGAINPELAREIFIRSALVEGAWANHHAVLAHNAHIRREAEELEQRNRRRGLIDDEAIFAFYDQRLPAEVVSASHFDAWGRRVDDPALLEMSLDDLLSTEESMDATGFPDRWRVEGHELATSYTFDPGSGRDGVSVTIPMTLMNQLTGAGFSWQVPGFRQDLATELIRSLPKSVRTNFVPAPDHARRALQWLTEHGADRTRPFPLELGRALRQLTGTVVPEEAWRPAEVPTHLRPTFVVTSKGRPDRVGKDFDALRREVSEQLSRTLTRTVNRASKDREVSGATSWTFGDLPVRIDVGKGPTKAVGHPALRDEGATVGQVVLDTATAAAASHHRGVRRLLTLTNPDPTRWVISHLSNAEKVALPHSPYGSVPELMADARLKTVDSLALARCRADLVDVRSAAAYDELAQSVRQDQADRMRQVVSTAAQVLTTRLDVLELIGTLGQEPAARDVAQQLDNLVFTNFISATPDPWYGHLPRYLKGTVLRLEGVARNRARDAQSQDLLDELEDEYAALCAAQPPGPLPAAVEEIAFLLEELRVSLFAQTLRTPISISPKRVRKAIDAAR